jgi:hypothetical protein
MSELEKIDNLIESGTSENNYLAMQLMLKVLQLPFEEAYSKLKIKNKNDELLNLDIGEISIEYKVDLQRIIYAASSYADIDRNVFFRGVEIPNAKKRLHADDDSILGLGEYGGVDELREIKEDLSSLCNLVMELFEREEL